MSFLFKISFVANLGLALFAWWLYENSYGAARKMLQQEMAKLEAAKTSGSSDLLNCQSVWKIAFDLRGVTEIPPMTEESPSTDSTNAPVETHDAEKHASPSEDTHAEHPKDSAHAAQPESPKDPWMVFLKQKAKEEKVWDAKIKVLKDSDVRYTVQGGSCRLGVVVQGLQLISLDISAMR